MLLISFLLASSLSFAQKLPQLLTKHAPETLRYISSDGNIAYVKKNNGVLGLIVGYRSSDFMSDATYSDFLVTDSQDKVRIAIEVIPNHHRNMQINKNHKIYVTKLGMDKPTEVGVGRYPSLHQGDDWISFYKTDEQQIILKNVVTNKEYKIPLLKKSNPFFFPSYVMSTQVHFLYSDVDEKGYAQISLFDLSANKSRPLLKGDRPGTFFELCQNKNYFAVGEFPYEGIERGSRILHFPKDGNRPAGFTTIYQSGDADVGNMVCTDDSVYFIKTTSFDSVLVTKKTEAARVKLADSKLEIKTDLGYVSSLIRMDGRVLVPFREYLYVLEGVSNIESDVLRRNPDVGE